MSLSSHVMFVFDVLFSALQKSLAVTNSCDRWMVQLMRDDKGKHT